MADIPTKQGVDGRNDDPCIDLYPSWYGESALAPTEIESGESPLVISRSNLTSSIFRWLYNPDAVTLTGLHPFTESHMTRRNRRTRDRA